MPRQSLGPRSGRPRKRIASPQPAEENPFVPKRKRTRDDHAGRRTASPGSCASKLLLALEMFDLGVAILEQNLRRRWPRKSPRQIQRMLGRWLQTRPGAELGDGPGRPRKLKMGI